MEKMVMKIREQAGKLSEFEKKEKNVTMTMQKRRSSFIKLQSAGKIDQESLILMEDLEKHFEVKTVILNQENDQLKNEIEKLQAQIVDYDRKEQEFMTKMDEIENINQGKLAELSENMQEVQNKEITWYKEKYERLLSENNRIIEDKLIMTNTNEDLVFFLIL